MFINSNDKCPVCNNNFTSDDDIVFCPICGTPHHRDCYNSIGHCYNASKHKSGFEYSTPVSDSTDVSSPDEIKNENQNYYSPQSGEYNSYSEQSDNKAVCSQCNAEIDKSSPFCSRCGARQENAQYQEYSPLNGFGFNNSAKQYEDNTQTIDGYSVADVATVVRTNTDRFIPKFLKNKKLSWNWSAFFFGPYYLFYRKMYKQGIMFLAINLIVQYIFNGVFAKEIRDYSLMLSQHMQDCFNNPDIENFQQVLMDTLIGPDYIRTMRIVGWAITIIFSVIIALFADSFYKTKVMQVLGSVEKNLQQGASFNVVTPMLDDTSPLSQADMKKLYLGKMGGTNILSPIVAWAALDIVESIVSKIISLF